MGGWTGGARDPRLDLASFSCRRRPVFCRSSAASLSRAASNSPLNASIRSSSIASSCILPPPPDPSRLMRTPLRKKGEGR